jgi:hypothetical protein
MKKRIVLILLLFLPACAPWLRAGGSYESPSHNFSVYIPDGWMRLDTDRYLLLSKEGPFLQYVLIQDRHLDKPFRHTKKKMKAGMLAQEASEVVLDEITSDQTIMDFEVLENVPTKIDGQDGFRLLFTYTNRDGLKLKTVYYGFLSAERFYSIRYTAAKRYYFLKEIPIFDQLLNSFKLIHPRTA